MNIVVKKASKNDIKEYYNILIDRINWLKEKNINQLDESYLVDFNYDYFIKNKNNMHVAVKDNKVVGGMLIRDRDIYYSRKGKSFYIHHFISLKEEKSVGSILLDYALKYAKENNKDYLRLDCINTNEKLNSYYLKNGFICTDIQIKKDNYYNLYEKEVIKA